LIYHKMKQEQQLLYFSIKPLDKWAYQNVDYTPANFFGINTNNAVEMFLNEFDNMSLVYRVIAQDGYYTLKNAKLDHYVKYKTNNPNLVHTMVQNYYLKKILI
jgi:hypothetical protein